MILILTIIVLILTPWIVGPEGVSEVRPWKRKRDRVDIEAMERWSTM